MAWLAATYSLQRCVGQTHPLLNNRCRRSAGSLVSIQAGPKTFAVPLCRVGKKNFPSDPGLSYSGKTLCVTGILKIWDGKPVIIITDQGQVQVGC